jgi:hypothetical protein
MYVAIWPEIEVVLPAVLAGHSFVFKRGYCSIVFNLGYCRISKKHTSKLDTPTNNRNPKESNLLPA